MTRHPIIATSLALLVVLATGGVPRSSAPTAREPRERLLEQDEPSRSEKISVADRRSWSLDQTAGPRRIEGYASEVSVLPGQKVHFHVSTSPAARYRIVLYRLGWYRGAGARIFACIPGCCQGSKGQGSTPPSSRPGDRARSGPVARY